MDMPSHTVHGSSCPNTPETTADIPGLSQFPPVPGPSYIFTFETHNVDISLKTNSLANSSFIHVTTDM